MVTEVDDSIWTIDGPDVYGGGAFFPTRMTVVRLSDGRLWIHSPIQLDDNVRASIEDLGGGVAALVAPNKFHYLFVEPWREAFPLAKMFAEEDLLRKVPSLADANVLDDTPPNLYSKDLDQVIFSGNRLLDEVVFFHRSSRSLIVTDLLSNLDPNRMKLLAKIWFKFQGVTYPNGGVPRLYRWLMDDKESAKRALATIMQWQPKRILFCHGKPFDLTAQRVLDREFSFLR